jgi:hypothetical protein
LRPAPDKLVPAAAGRDTDRQQRALVAGTVEGSDQTPASRLVQRLSMAGFQLPQHEVGRSGLPARSRHVPYPHSDGDAKLWIARRRHIGAGEASSGLRYDDVLPVGNNY